MHAMIGSLDAAVEGYAAGLAEQVAAAVASGRALVPSLARRLADHGLSTDESLREHLSTLPIPPGSTRAPRATAASSNIAPAGDR